MVLLRAGRAADVSALPVGADGSCMSDQDDAVRHDPYQPKEPADEAEQGQRVDAAKPYGLVVAVTNESVAARKPVPKCHWAKAPIRMPDIDNPMLTRQPLPRSSCRSRLAEPMR
jgi:hypothetical protein